MKLAELIAEYDVPGAAVAYLHQGETREFAAGTLNRDTGVEVTTDALFQIGSVTKLYTATLLMRQVERGRLTLDTPVRAVLPEFAVSDPRASAAVTVRHLLSHTSGIDGDLFLDTGRGDDCLAKYVDACADLAQNHPLGATQSYCNAGFVIAGRMLERLEGKRWDDVLREQIAEPLGLTHTWTLPEDVLRFRAAIGHREGSTVRHWGLMRSMGPAGLICARPADVVAFARAHLEGGLLDDPRAMWEPQVELPNPHGIGSHWGLGWILADWDGHRVISHGGNTIGQHAMLWAVPGTGTIVCVTANGGYHAAFTHAVATELFAELDGIAVPPRLAPPESPAEVDAARFAGVYERTGSRFTVIAGDGGLSVRYEPTGAMAEMPGEHEELPLLPVDATTFACRPPGDPAWQAAVFHEVDGRSYLHFAGRATPKVTA
ncbi:beta-lactamase family protein [Nonomuraea sp. NN258]|uniref:serine hydrolase domain-containing protein n=1 Tax=Nonomuraea antri TaxID=2730852 RepID=UPI0015689D99|nr:serine hydrolase domain-containing protein [Nonomuraea antri]NRQ36358.1 beta-lactamase family protein [Nonomuraea antri]